MKQKNVTREREREKERNKERMKERERPIRKLEEERECVFIWLGFMGKCV